MRLDVDARLATQAHTAAIDAAILAHEETAIRALDRIVRRYVREGVASVLRPLTAAGGDYDPPTWRVPLPVDLIDQDAMEKDLEARGRTYSDNVAATTTGIVGPAIGVSFEQSNALLEGVIAAQAGRRITTAPQDLVKVMMTSLQKSYDDGHSIPKAAREMRAAGYAHSKSYATRIARTELIGAVNAASLAQVQGATTIPYKLWMSTGDNRTRPTHRAAEGQTVPIDSAFLVGGHRLEYPGDSNGPGEEVIMCRCTLGYTDEAAPGKGASPARGTSQTRSAADTFEVDPDVGGNAGRAAHIAGQAISKVVNLPRRIPIKALPDSDAATARSRADGSIAVHGDSGLHAQANAIVHEAGHVLDRSLLGTESEWFTQTEASQALYRAMRSSPTIQRIINDEVRLLEGDAQTKAYMLQGREMFARAFQQHVAIVSKDPELLAEIRHLQSDDLLSFQVWQDDEFEAIAAEMQSALSHNLTAGGSMSATETITEDATTAGSAWSGIIAQEGVDTGDGRRIEAGALNWRELPLTMMGQHTTPGSGGHADAQVAGRIDAISRDGENIIGGGVFDSGAWGAETQRMVTDGMLKGISIDLAINDAEIIPAEGVEDEVEAMFLGTLNVLDGTILGATVVPFAAFENATIAIVAGGAMKLGQFRKLDDGRTAASFYMPFAPFPAAEPGEGTPDEENTDKADAISEITDVVNGYPGLDGKVVVTIDGEDTTVAFPAADAEPAPEDAQAAQSPEVTAALARLVTALERSRA